MRAAAQPRCCNLPPPENRTGRRCWPGFRACRPACAWIFDFVNGELHRRQLGYGRGGRQKIEKDHAEALAGIRHGQTIGAPIALRIENRDWANWERAMAVEDRAEDRRARRPLTAPRPGHADLAGALKFNFHDARYILERASARETAARVAARRAGEAFSARIRLRDPEPRRRAWGTCDWSGRRRGGRSKPSARIWIRRCAAWMRKPRRA